MSELLDLAQRLVDRAQDGEQLEAFLTHAREFQVKTFEGEVDTLSSAEPMGAGVRVARDGRIGFAFTTDLEDKGLDEVVGLARDNSAHTTQDPAVALPRVDGAA